MFAAILAFGLTFGAPKPPCVAPLFATCANSRALWASKDFQEALQRFLGDAEGDYRQHDRSAYKEVVARLFDPYAPPRDLGGGARLYPGCRFAECPEKAAVIIDRSGIVAIGVLDYHSDFNPALEVLVQRSGPASAARAGVLKAWADQAVADDAARMHGPIVLKGVTVRALREETASAAPAKACSKVAALMRRCRPG